MLPKQDLILHLTPQVLQEQNLPVFHFITVCQQNVTNSSITIIDSHQEIQFGYRSPQENPPVSGLATTIITLHQPSHQTEYSPYLVENTFENVLQLQKVIFNNGHLSTLPDPLIQCDWSVSQIIPIPTERGNHFFPSFPFHNQENLCKLFYDVSAIPFRYANTKLYNLHPSKPPSGENKLMLDNFAKCITNSEQCLFYDEIIAEVIMKNFRFNELSKITEDYVYCPFIFPAHYNLHHMIIHPDSMFVQQQQPNLTIFREHRSPVFNIISKLSVVKTGFTNAVILTPVRLYANIQSKELVFSFKDHLSAVYEISDHEDNSHYTVENPETHCLQNCGNQTISHLTF